MELKWRPIKGLDILLSPSVVAVIEQTKCGCGLFAAAHFLHIIHLISDISYRTGHSICIFPTCVFANSGRGPPELGIKLL
jgi:hypothetical protein